MGVGGGGGGRSSRKEGLPYYIEVFKEIHDDHGS